MITQKITLAVCISALSATLLSSNAHAMNCAALTGNQFLAAVERGQCQIGDSAQNSNVVVTDNTWIRTSRNAGGDRGSTAGKAGGGYKY